jgi:hypothetical protein
MADQAVQWANVSDVDTLKSMLAAQQAQLAQLQKQKPAAAAAAAAPHHSDRKRKAVRLHEEECSDFEDDDDELGLDQGQQADDDEYNPANSSGCEEPKKKKQVHAVRLWVSDTEACRKRLSVICRCSTCSFMLFVCDVQPAWHDFTHWSSRAGAPDAPATVDATLF